MSTFLELCQLVRDKTGITRDGLPTTVIGQEGQLKYLIENTVRADLFIQRLHTDWNFLWNEYQLTLVAGSESQAVPSDVGSWDLESFVIGKGTDDVTELTYIPYKTYRETYNYNVTANTETPATFTIRPDGALLFNPVPNAGHSLTAEYWKKPVKMTADADTSDIPERFESAIIELSKFYYAEKRHDGGLMAASWADFQNELTLLEDNELPERYETNSQSPQLVVRVE